jgi:hypothetical protein
MAIEFDEYGYIFNPVVCKGNGGALNHSFRKFFSNGVVATGFVDSDENDFPNDLKVTAGLNAVTVAPGMIIINGRYGILENAVTLPIDPPDTAEERVDYIIARATDSVGGKTVMELDVIKGIPGDIPEDLPVIVNDGVTSEHIIASVSVIGEIINVAPLNPPLSLKRTVGGTSQSTLSPFAQYEYLGEYLGELAFMKLCSATKTCAFLKDEDDNLYKTEIELQNFSSDTVVFKITPKEANYAAFTTAGVRWGAQTNGKLMLYATTDPGEIEVTIDWLCEETT